MKIGIDVQSTLGHKTGFGYYVFNLVKYLRSIDKENKYFEFAPEKSHDLSAPQRFMWDQFGFPKMAKTRNVDILHQPCYSAPLWYKGKVVLTIHDIISTRFGKDLPFFARMYFSRFMPATYKKADAIITDAEFTKKDLIKIGLDPKKISVIPLAVSDEFQKMRDHSIIDKIKKKYHLGEEYILNVGSLNPRKNLKFLIEVFFEVYKKYPKISLVLTGEGWYKKELISKIDQLGITQNVIFTGYTSDADKIALYNGAKLFAFPSLYEGFGFPPLEAMACGVPVICSDASSLPEVVGDAGILLNPHDKEKWIHSILSILRDHDKLQGLSHKSLERAKQFSWEKCARKTLEVYESLL